MDTTSADPEILAAAERGDLETVRRLLDGGADPNAHRLANPDDSTSRIPALYFACVNGHAAVARLLLERGADPNDGESVYHAAEHDHRECLELLLAHGADLSGAHPRWENTPLYFLAGYGANDVRLPTVLRGARWLLEHGADPNVPSYASRETPLHAFMRNGHGAEVVELLAAHGADLGARRADGRTPLVLALRSGATAAARALRDRGASAAGMTPADELIAAVMEADEAAARAVLAAHPGLMEGLDEDDLAAPARAAVRDRPAAIALMARLGFRLDEERLHPGTPLHWAAWNGRPASVRTLIGLGAPLDIRDREFGSSPLGWAAHGSANCRNADDDYREVVDLLIEAGASAPAAINRWGEPPENLASTLVAARLKERGAGGEPPRSGPATRN